MNKRNSHGFVADRRGRRGCYLEYNSILCNSEGDFFSIFDLESLKLIVEQGVFLVWCYHPKSQGAQSVYTTVVKGTIAPLLGIKAEEEKKAN